MLRSFKPFFDKRTDLPPNEQQDKIKQMLSTSNLIDKDYMARVNTNIIHLHQIYLAMLVLEKYNRILNDEGFESIMQNPAKAESIAKKILETLPFPDESEEASLNIDHSDSDTPYFTITLDL